MVRVEMRRNAHLPFMRGSIYGKFPSIVQAENSIISSLKMGEITDEIFDFYKDGYIKSMQRAEGLLLKTFDRYSVQEEKS
jgi:hypothetical protein